MVEEGDEAERKETWKPSCEPPLLLLSSSGTKSVDMPSLLGKGGRGGRGG